MVNATCDFCANTYRKNPRVGYFKVSSALKSSLCIREGADLNTICSEHFSDADIAESGRLMPEAKPVFFPRVSTAAHDHPYVISADAQDDNEDAVALPSTPERPEEVEEYPGIFAEEEGEEDSDDPEDSDYHPSQGQSSASTLNPSSQKLEDSSGSPKVIVYISLLLELFTVCRVAGCGAAIDPGNLDTYTKGACLVVSGTCNNSHSFKWSSSPMKGQGQSKYPAINILIATFTLLCGMHVDQVIAFFKHLEIAVPGPTFFYQMYSNLIYKCVWSFWLEMQANLIQRGKDSGTPLNLAGDGKYDSPGFTARYCTYYMMDLADRSIVALWVAVKHQVSSSSAMEPYACKTLLLSLIENFQVRINSITTDRSSTIKQMMMDDSRLSGVTHCYDTWHWIKSVLKDLWDCCKRKYAKNLQLWVPSITNMLWWSFSTSRDKETLKEKVLSIPRHITNRHSFPSNKHHKACSHGDLTGAEGRKPWLKEDSKQVQKLTAALRGHQDIRLKDLENMTEFHHTGFIENVNSLNNKYCSKTYVFGYDGMLVRAAITAVDHNYNLNRPQALTKEGKLRYKLECNRAGGKFIVREIKVPKDNSWRDKVADLVMQCIDTGTVPVVEIPVGKDIPKNQAKVERPKKCNAVEKHQSRMKL